MGDHRFLLADELPPDDGVLPIDEQQLHHAMRALRITVGERVEVVSPSGEGFRVEVRAVHSDGIEFRRVEPLTVVWEPAVDLFQGFAKGDKMDTIIRQAVEVGASRVVPVLTARTIVRLDERKRADRGERFRRIALSAAEQSHRGSVPHIDDPMGFTAALTLLEGYDSVFVAWEDHRGDTLTACLGEVDFNADPRVAIFIGPEGGLAAEEVDALVGVGARPVTLGPTIMRTETAAIAAVALAVAAAYEQAARDA